MKDMIFKMTGQMVPIHAPIPDDVFDVINDYMKRVERAKSEDLIPDSLLESKKTLFTADGVRSLYEIIKNGTLGQGGGVGSSPALDRFPEAKGEDDTLAQKLEYTLREYIYYYALNVHDLLLPLIELKTGNIKPSELADIYVSSYPENHTGKTIFRPNVMSGEDGPYNFLHDLKNQKEGGSGTSNDEDNSSYYESAVGSSNAGDNESY